MLGLCFMFLVPDCLLIPFSLEISYPVKHLLRKNYPFLPMKEREVRTPSTSSLLPQEALLMTTFESKPSPQEWKRSARTYRSLLPAIVKLFHFSMFSATPAFFFRASGPWPLSPLPFSFPASKIPDGSLLCCFFFFWPALCRLNDQL